MKVAIISDTHFGARGDSLPMQANMAKFFTHVFFPTLDQMQIQYVVHLGDYTDRRKYVNYQTARFIETTYREPLRQRHVRELILLGNHDCFYKQTNDINSVEELYRHDASVTIVKAPREVTIGSRSILLLPWIADDTRDVALDLLAHTRATVVMGHLEIGGFQMYRGVPHEQGGLEATRFDRFALVLSGHFHHKSERAPITYVGAPYPMIWSDYDDPRGFHILDTDTLALTFISNPFSLFARLVYDDAHEGISYGDTLRREIDAVDSRYRDAYVKVIVKSRTQPATFEAVMESLYKVNPLDVDVIDDVVVNDDGEEVMPSLDVDTLHLMREYVDSLTINCNKDDLNSYLQHLYHEALAANQSTRFA